MGANINDLIKIKTTLAFKQCLFFVIKSTIFILLLLNIANFFFAGVITRSIVRWINSLFNYTIPNTVPDWFALYVIVLYLIVLIPLNLTCIFLAEKLENFNKYNISFDVEQLRNQLETIKKQVLENEQQETYSNTSITQLEHPIFPSETKILEPSNIKTKSSLPKAACGNLQGHEKAEDATFNQLHKTVPQDTDEGMPINVIDSLNEFFVSKENIEDISEENEVTEITSAFPKISGEDYIDRNKTKQDIGLKGEYFILKYEKSELIKNDRMDLASKIRHISKDEGDYLGYDILSYDKQGNEKYIEVKTSVKSYTADFFLTENEMNKIKRLSNYFIYRVFDFDIQTEKGNLYIVDCKKDFFDFFIIQPTHYKVSPRKK